MPQAAHDQREALKPLARNGEGCPGLGFDDPPHDRARHAPRDLGLYLEHILDIAIVALRP